MGLLEVPISIKKDLKTNTAAETAGADAAAPRAAAVAELELLRQTGFDEATAKVLVARQSAEVIRRQIQWLPLRNTTRNRLGLLRRAIEEDWPRPEGIAEETGQPAGREFARHYYAAYHGYIGEARTEPFPVDIQAAAQLVTRLLALRNEPLLVPDWGRRFGNLLRQKHQGDPKSRPNLLLAVVLHGDEFLRRLETERTAGATNARQKAQAVRQATLWPHYLAYLQLAEKDAQRTHPDLYAAFANQRQRTRLAMMGGLFHAAPKTLARFDADDSRRLAWAEYCRAQAPAVVLDF